MTISNTPPHLPHPAISVIIPMYNAEKYLADCLESILKQTFQDFEVIAVNDCSTDSSCAIVESYVPKFDGRLTLEHMEKNSGSPALPRNKGFGISRGKYIFFMDADDMILETALEELYTLAEDYNAEVVYCEKYYSCDSDGKNIRVESMQRGDFVDKPTFATEDLAERVNGILNQRYWVFPWDKLVRRDLMAEHNIHFPHSKVSDDNVWTYGLVFYAKKYLRVPNIVYIYRDAENSNVRAKRAPQQVINFWINPVLFALKTLDKFMSDIPFFKMNPSYRYAVLEFFVMMKYNNALGANLKLPPYVIYDSIKQEFGKNFGEYDVSVAVLCTYAATLNKIYRIKELQFNEAQERIAELETELDKLKDSIKI